MKYLKTKLSGLSKKQTLNGVLAAALIVLSGCASMTGAENRKNLAQLKYGMNQAQVIALLGMPDTVSEDISNAPKNTDQWIYELRSGQHKGVNIFLRFEQNTLVKTGKLDGRIVASSEDRYNGACTRLMNKEMRDEPLCIE